MISDLKLQIQKSTDHLKKEFASLQTGRASVALVEDIQVDSYGTLSPMKQIANIACPDPKTIRIEPWDKNAVGSIEKAIQEAKIGINPQNMGTFIFLPIPPMTEERRKQIVKLVHELGEKAKISIRSVRHESMKFIKLQKEENEISEDQQKDLENDIQKLVDQGNKDIEVLAKKKEKEVMSI